MTTYGLRENICKGCYWQGLNFQNIKTAHTTEKQKNKQPNTKMGRRLSRHFSKEYIRMIKRHMKRCSSPLIIKKCRPKLQ